jgi:hypothetical protein
MPIKIGKQLPLSSLNKSSKHSLCSLKILLAFHDDEISDKPGFGSASDTAQAPEANAVIRRGMLMRGSHHVGMTTYQNEAA